MAFPVVRKLLALNQGASPENPRVEVILLSRNSADTGLRIFNSIQHYGLGIIRATFTGEPTWPYVKPFGTDLFLSANPESVRSALRHRGGNHPAQAAGRDRCGSRRPDRYVARPASCASPSMVTR